MLEADCSYPERDHINGVLTMLTAIAIYNSKGNSYCQLFSKKSYLLITNNACFRAIAIHRLLSPSCFKAIFKQYKSHQTKHFILIATTLVQFVLLLPKQRLLQGNYRYIVRLKIFLKLPQEIFRTNLNNQGKGKSNLGEIVCN